MYEGDGLLGSYVNGVEPLLIHCVACLITSENQISKLSDFL
jgi:hypothetical protein